ncbi:restriction endonuclease subunit S [Saprospira sp. CCB-QB6]|uniref:restriction endonuclease subunit S n=1 Tax=Saprospira sp. CCB-QB6 TaxID=3023936 RepID=UPI00234A5CAF|nr:restriction endonuclease subunit S [Saprospira sp. CCB-QB6]WCL81312.1 restriction endonuclease subunit S [Saprospira sp. CCB-QB6]
MSRTKKTAKAVYSAYKDSGVAWLGEVPAHWEVVPNKYIFKLNKVLVGKNSANYDLLSLTLKGIIRRDMENPQGKFPAEFDTYQEVSKGDFVFCLFDVEETPRTVGLSDYNGMITGAYTVMKVASGIEKRFLYYFYLNLDTGKKMKFLYRGLRNTIPKDSFFSFKTCLPPLPEQRRIADYLDQKCAQIDLAIAQKERMIALLEERQQIVIQRAVSQGLDSGVEMKDSGVAWLGEIPAHWEVRRGSTIGAYSKGTGIKKDEVKEKGLPCIRYGEIYTHYNLKFDKTKSFIDEGVCNTTVSKGALMLTGSGETLEDIGKCVVYLGEETIYVGGDIIILYPVPQILPLFLSYLINSECVRYQRARDGKGGIIVHIYSKNFKAMLFPLPPLSEQERIAKHLDEVVSKTARAVLDQRKGIKALREYREVLIDEVVRGRMCLGE